VFLFSYNRQDLLKDRLEDLIGIKSLELFVSIAWHSSEHMEIFEKLLNQYVETCPSGLRCKYRFHKSNQGLAVHLTETITSALNPANAPRGSYL
jgi:hypothetical protein